MMEKYILLGDFNIEKTNFPKLSSTYTLLDQNW